MNLSASSAKPADPTYFLEGIIHDKSEMPVSYILLTLPTAEPVKNADVVVFLIKNKMMYTIHILA